MQRNLIKAISALASIIQVPRSEITLMQSTASSTLFVGKQADGGGGWGEGQNQLHLARIYSPSPRHCWRSHLHHTLRGSTDIQQTWPTCRDSLNYLDSSPPSFKKGWVFFSSLFRSCKFPYSSGWSTPLFSQMTVFHQLLILSTICITSGSRSDSEFSMLTFEVSGSLATCHLSLCRRQLQGPP